MLRRPAPSHAVICCNSVYGQRLKTSPGSAAGWIAGWFAGWFGGDNRKQNCNEHVARSIPVCLGCNSVLGRRQRHSAGCTGFCFYGISWETVGKNGGEERRGRTAEEVRWGMYWKNWMYQKNGCGNQDNFRKFVLKIFWGHEL